MTKWPYEVVGAGYGLLGIGFIAVGHLRIRRVEVALRQGEFEHLRERLLAALLVVGIALGAATVALVVFGG